MSALVERSVTVSRLMGGAPDIDAAHIVGAYLGLAPQSNDPANAGRNCRSRLGERDARKLLQSPLGK